MTPRQLPSLSARSIYSIKRADTEPERKMQALKAVLGTAGIAFGAGAGARGLSGLKRMLFPPEPLESHSPYLARQIKVPVVRQERQDEDDRERLGLAPGTDLRAAALSPPQAPTLSIGHDVTPSDYLAKMSSVLERVAQGLAKTAQDPALPAAPQSSWTDYLPPTTVLGMPTSHPAASPYYIPMGIGAGAAGLVGGWKLVDHVLKGQRKANQTAQIEKAKQDYRKALNEQYETMLPSMKTASISLGAELEKVAVAWEKQGVNWHMPDFGSMLSKVVPQNLTDTAGGALGTYNTVLGLTTAGAGLGAYSWTKNRSKAHALEEALRQRRMERAKRPAPVMAEAEEVTPEEFAKT